MDTVANISGPDKQDLRRELRRFLENSLPETFKYEGIRAVTLLRAAPFWRDYSTILIFISSKYEIDTQPLLEMALTGGKKIFAPKTTGQRLRFHRIFSPEGPWERGPFGIREPGGDKTKLAVEDFPALILTPGLGFDRQGGRLGHGGGWYDRFFAELDTPGPLPYFALGLCTTGQIVPQIPVDTWDKRMNGLCTGDELTVFA